MRKIIFIILLCFAWNLSSAPGRAEIFLPMPKTINHYEELIKAIVWVECHNNYNLVGTHNDTGPFQITPIRLKDYNQRTGNKHELRDCFDYELSKKIFLHYAKGSYEKVARLWNGGPNGMNKESTKEYFEKVQKVLNKSI